MAPFRLGDRVRFSGTDTSLNTTFCLSEQKFRHLARARTLSQRVVLWRQSWTLNKVLPVPGLFPMLQCNTLNKLVGAKLTNEETIDSWAPRSLDSILLSARAQGPSTGNTYEAYWNPEEISKEPLPKLRTLLTPNLSRSALFHLKDYQNRVLSIF